MSKIHTNCTVVFLHFLISCIVSVPTSGQSLLEMKFQFLFWGRGVLSQLLNGENIYCAGGKHFWRWKQTCFMLEVNTLALERRAFKLWPHTHTHTAGYQRLLKRPCVEMTVTHRYSLTSENRCLTLTYSHPSTLHPQILYTPTVISAGLNGLQVDLVDKENDKQTFAYILVISSQLVTACNAHVQ